MEIVSSIVGKIADCFFDATGRQLGYLLQYNDNISALRKQVQKLADARGGVQGNVDVAKRKGEIIKADVHNWISEVDNLIAEAEKVLDDEVKTNQKCLGGCCVNLSTRYKFSKEAQKKILEISGIQEEGKFTDVSLPAPPPEIISSSKSIFGSRKSTMKQIMEALNDEKVNIIGVCGLGGVGKTTIVKEISKQAKENKLFDDAVMATVSQNPVVTKIQEDLAIRLGLTLSGNDESTRASSLWTRIKAEKQILVILDDIWERIDLEKVGIPFGRDHPGCKILLTSRSQAVCDQMEAGNIFTLETLSEEESWLLFKEAVGQVVDNSDINPIAREVIAECGGLPIAILTVGRTLRNKGKRMWDDVALQLKKSTLTNIEGMSKEVISSLELSYNYLENEEAKSLFLFCCLFPEDHNIEIEVLSRYGMGLRWFKNIDTVEEARLRTDAIVSSLISSFLLIAGDGEGSVKMHDVVRDVAITIASKPDKSFMVKAGIRLKVWPNRDSYEDLTAMSLMRNDIREIPDGLNCPKLQVLLLQENRSLVVISNLFFEGMKDLKVLDLSSTKISSLPSSFLFLANLRTLHVEGSSLRDLSLIGNLRNLEILSLRFSEFEEIPSCFSRLNHLRFLDLTGCRNLKLIPQGVISCLKRLEVLYMMHSFSSWDDEKNAQTVELLALSRLTTLMIRIPQSNYLSNRKSFEDLNRFTIVVDILWDEFERIIDILCEEFEGIITYENYSRTMGLSHNANNGPLVDWVKCLLKRSEFLYLYNIIGIEKVQDDLLVEEGFKELKYIILCSNKGIKYLLNTLEWEPQHATFNNLEALILVDNSIFVEICHGQAVPAESFSKLKELYVDSCDSILNIVSGHLLQRLRNLQRCVVYRCESLVYVFDLQELEIRKEETKFLSSLKKIELVFLPNMTHIWKGDIRSISLHSLYKVKIDGCDKLVNIFTTAIAKSLVLLKKLVISMCSGVQEIVIDEEGEKGESAEKIVFPNLYKIHLLHLNSLTCFCSVRYPIEFPALEQLWIVNCPKMKTFGNGDQLTPKLKTVDLQHNSRWNGDLNNTVKQFYQQEMIKEEEAMKAGRLTETIATAENKDQQIVGS